MDESRQVTEDFPNSRCFYKPFSSGYQHDVRNFLADIDMTLTGCPLDRETGKWPGIFLIFDKNRFLFVLKVLHKVIMHLGIPALFVQSEQATWVQKCEDALGCCLQRSLEQEIFSLLMTIFWMTGKWTGIFKIF